MFGTLSGLGNEYFGLDSLREANVVCIDGSGCVLAEILNIQKTHETLPNSHSMQR